MTSPLERASALVRKATDPATSEEESRTCAVVACKLIREHNLLSGGAAAPSSWRGVGVRIDGSSFEEILRVVFQDLATPARRPGPPPAPPKPRSPPRRPRTVLPSERMARIDAMRRALRQRAPDMDEEKIRSAATSAVDEEIRRGL